MKENLSRKKAGGAALYPAGLEKGGGGALATDTVLAGSTTGELTTEEYGTKGAGGARAAYGVATETGTAAAGANE